MPTAFISPFINTTNDYINRVKEVLHECGYEVRPLSFRTLLSQHAWGLMKPDNVVLVHWLESRVFSEGRAGARVRPAGLIQFMLYALVLAVMRARLIYFVHDHAVHDLVGWRRECSRRLISVLRWLADVVVVHDPNFCKQYRAQYLPHPLYQERRTQIKPRSAGDTQFRAGVLGAIRPYKRIEHIIDVWPEGPELVIRGRCDTGYETLLRKHIANRPTANITLAVGFMSRDDFDSELDRLDALLLPHADASALVSGAFFEAIGAVPMVIARTSPFIRWAKERFDSVIPFMDESNLPNIVHFAAQARKESDDLLRSSAAIANELFGADTCRREYKKVLQS